MLDLATWTQLATPIAIILLAIVIVAVGWRLSRLIQDVGALLRGEAIWNGLVGRGGLDRMSRQIEANKRLISEEDGRQLLLNFYRSEAEVAAFLRELDEVFEESDSYEMFLKTAQKRVKEVQPVERDPDRWTRVKAAARMIGGKLFDKANDLVKSYIGLGDSKG